MNELSLFCNLSMYFCLECILFLPVRSYSNNYFSYYNTQHDRLFRVHHRHRRQTSEESCNRQNVPNLTILAAVLIKNHRNGRRRNYKAPTFVAARPIDGPRLSSEWRRRGGVAPEEEQGFSHFLLTLETMLVEPWWFHRTIKRKHTQRRRTCAIPFAFGDRSFSCSIRHDRGTNERFLDPPARCPCLASTVSSDRFEGSRCR